MRDNDTQTESVPSVLVFKFQPFAPFDGIIAFLTPKCGGNVCLMDLVRVTLSSPHVDNVASHPPQRVVNFTNCIEYCHTEKAFARQWVRMDFKTMRMFPTHYSFQSRIPNCAQYLSGWVIEGSEEDANGPWLELDHRSNASDLDGPGFQFS
jgi:hypothetical protein